MPIPQRLEDLVPNAELGHYRILHHIAEGGMGHVYKAWEPSLNREVAIKVLREEFCDNPRYLRFFDEEAHNIAALRHANIVPIYFVGTQGELRYFVMPFIEGSTLDDWIEADTRMSVEQAEFVLRQAVDALDWALTHKIVHLDIKPSNFLLDPSGAILLTDFGLARSLSASGEENLECFGTPAYISPEQILNQPTDQRSDIYSLGATIYHLMTMRFLYDSDSVEEIILSHLQRPFPRQEAEEIGIPPGWINLLERMTQKRPEDRFQDYKELRSALNRVDRLTPVSFEIETAEDTRPIPVPIRSGEGEKFLHGLLTPRYTAWTTAAVSDSITWNRKSVLEAVNSTSKPLKFHHYAKIFTEIASAPSGDVNDLAEAFEMMPELKDFTHALANTSFFGKDNNAVTPKKVIRTLGKDLCKELLFTGLMLRDETDRENPFDWMPLWRHSIGVGLVANFLIYFMVRRGPDKQKEKVTTTFGLAKIALSGMFTAKIAARAYFAGLMHDIGKMILADIAGYPFYIAARKAYEKQEPLHLHERAVFGIDHMEVAAVWLAKHRFDAAIRHVAAEHNHLDKIRSPLSAAVALANQFLKRHGYSYSGSPIVDCRDFWSTKAWKELLSFSKNDSMTPEYLEAEFLPLIGELPYLEKPSRSKT